MITVQEFLALSPSAALKSRDSFRFLELDQKCYTLKLEIYSCLLNDAVITVI
jgi:hypothetical protein